MVDTMPFTPIQTSKPFFPGNPRQSIKGAFVQRPCCSGCFQSQMLRLQPCLDNKQGIAEGSTGSSSATSSPHMNGWRLDPFVTSGPITQAGFQLFIHRKVHLHTAKSRSALAALVVDYPPGQEGDPCPRPGRRRMSIVAGLCHAFVMGRI